MALAQLFLINFSQRGVKLRDSWSVHGRRYDGRVYLPNRYIVLLSVFPSLSGRLAGAVCTEPAAINLSVAGRLLIFSKSNPGKDMPLNSDIVPVSECYYMLRSN